MYNSILDQGPQLLLEARLSQAIARLRGLSLVTTQDALTEIYSEINKALTLGNQMTPLAAFREGPAKLGDLNGNLTILTTDAQTLASQILATEADASQLYNQISSLRNALHERLRTQIYSSTPQQYQEAFLSDAQWQAGYTISFDPDSVASLPQLTEKTIPISSVSAGPASLGALADGSSFASLLGSDPAAQMVWNGTYLELVLRFDTLQIINGVKVELSGYQGLQCEGLFYSPDGTFEVDLLTDYDESIRSMDGATGHSAGNWVAIFDPRAATELRLLVRAQYSSTLSLRSVTCLQRQYASSGSYQSQTIQAPQGTVTFLTDSHTLPALTDVQYQIAVQGGSFTNITPGTTLSLAGPYQYRATFTRYDQAYEAQGDPLGSSYAPPNSNYSLTSSRMTEIGQGKILRNFIFTSVTGAVDFQEIPTPGTFQASVNGTPVDANHYTLVGAVFTPVGTAFSNLSVQYQTSAYFRAVAPTLKNYATPYLWSVRFVGN